MDPKYVISKMHVQLVNIRQLYEDAVDGRVELSDVQREVHELRMKLRVLDAESTLKIRAAEQEREQRKATGAIRQSYIWPKYRRGRRVQKP